MIRQILRNADIKRFLILGALLFWCAGMIVVRTDRTGSGYYRFLIDNLFLAGIPLFLSTVLRITEHRQIHWTIKAGIFVLWLLFLPNAPYILTDILHLTRASHAPAWYDLALLLSCSGTGLLMGYLSLVDMQEIVTRNSNAVIGWIFALISLGLSGFAIYLGRFLRWNSWDVIITPTRLFQIIGGMLHPFSNSRALSVTLVFGMILMLGYISVRILFAHPGNQSQELRSKGWGIS